MEEVEGEYIDREKNFQQREHIVDQKVHELEMKQKWHKDNMKTIIRQPRNRAEVDIFLQV